MNRFIKVVALLTVFTALPTQGGIFSSRFDNFEELVKAGKTEDAAALYAKETPYFANLKDEKRKFVDSVMAERDQRYGRQLSEASVSLMIAEAETGWMPRWQQFRKSFEQARIAISGIGGLSAPGPLMTSGLASLKASVERKTQALQSEASQSLLEYGLFTDPPFPALYPVAVKWVNEPRFAARIEEQLAKASPEQLARFKKAYGKTLIPALGLAPKLAELYVDSRLRESGARSYLVKRLIRERLAKEGWPSAANNDRVLLAAWPPAKSDVSEYVVAPPAKVDYQLLEAEQTPEAFIATGAASKYALVVFLRPQAIRVESNESNKRQVNSQYQSGTRRIANPDYAQAQAELREAESQDAQITQMVNNAGNNQNMVSAMILATSAATAANRLSNARQALQNTPQIIEEPVMTPYAYSAKTVALKQSVKIPYAIYDTGTGNVVIGSAERTWSETIAVTDGVRDDDPTQASVLKSTKSPKYVESWISLPAKDQYDAVWETVFSDYRKKSLGI
ncbi:hypothetical protein EV700_3120 [Fluviicoccus keumensis]|uniref:LPP20 lipoprotein n=2 Tax=Fluviicoccus keumensis TaxID=1435465 RepID=A0A4Q7YHL9_9GAMM|nr:hypothetical protein EV700_3120 [Fluviicoccus keumensis]